MVKFQENGLVSLRHILHVIEAHQHKRRVYCYWDYAQLKIEDYKKSKVIVALL